MLLDNPIWFRERQAARVRRQRRPWLERLRPANLLLIWLLMVGVTAAVAICSYRGNVHWSDVDDVLMVSGVCAAYVQLAYITLRSLVGGAAAFARERELQTMDTLLASPLEPGSLLAGKWLVAAMPVLLELAVTAPVACLLLALQRLGHEANPHVTFAQLGDFMLLNVAMVFFFTAVGLLVSVRATHTGKAALRAVVIGLVVLLGTWLFDSVVSMFVSGHGSFVFVTTHFNPYFAVYSIGCSPWLAVTDEIYGYSWLWTVALYGIFGCLSLSLSWELLRRSST